MCCLFLPSRSIESTKGYLRLGFALDSMAETQHQSFRSYICNNLSINSFIPKYDEAVLHPIRASRHYIFHALSKRTASFQKADVQYRHNNTMSRLSQCLWQYVRGVCNSHYAKKHYLTRSLSCYDICGPTPTYAAPGCTTPPPPNVHLILGPTPIDSTTITNDPTAVWSWLEHYGFNLVPTTTTPSAPISMQDLESMITPAPRRGMVQAESDGEDGMPCGVATTCVDGGASCGARFGA
jgi:hypothetical protein